MVTMQDDEIDLFDDEEARPQRNYLRPWLILVVAVDIVILVGFFIQYLAAASQPPETDNGRSWYLLILSLAALPKITGAVAMLFRRKWGVMVFGVGCLAMMMDAFALVETGALPVAVAAGSAAMLWITVALSKQAGLMR
jgi:hypothetical protein